MKKSLQGIIAPISTPFVEDEIAYDRLAMNVRRYGETGLVGLFALGSNGENLALDEGERVRVLETVLSERSAEQTVIAGVSFESTRGAIRFGRVLAGMGADYISVLTPSYYKKALNDDVHIGHFQRIADAMPVPVIIYNAPGHTGVTLSPGVIETLAKHPNIAAMKDVAPGMFPHYLQFASESFSVIAGSIDSLLPALMLGAIGGVISLANPFPEACSEVYRLYTSGDAGGATALYRRLLRLNRSVAGAYAVAGVKAAMDLNGLFGGDPRRPLLPLTPAQRQALARAVDESGILRPG
jgi:4-hydroxy-2-oxoglutarate aldolase